MKCALMILLAGIAFLLPSALLASLNETLTFNANQFRLNQIVEQDSNTYITILGIGHDAYDDPENPGEPELPAVSVLYSIPLGMEVDQVILGNCSEVVMSDLQYLPHPMQTMAPPDSNPPFVPPGPIYHGTQIYPSSNDIITCTNKLSFIRGAGIATFLIRPIRYDPVHNRLLIIQNVSFTIIFRSTSKTARIAHQESIFTHTDWVGALKGAVENANDVDENLPNIPIVSNWCHHYYRYPLDLVVITCRALKSYWMPYVNWLTSHGYGADTVTIEYIYSHYSGGDNSERIRNFIIDKDTTDGLGYVLLGGNAQIVPGRICTCLPYQDNQSIFTDLYYSDIDDDWDSDNNGIFCDPDDTLNLAPDIMVGRVPVENPTDIANWWTKRLRYESNPGGGNTDYLSRVMIASADEPRDRQWYQSPAAILGAGYADIDTTFLREEPRGYDSLPYQPSGDTAILALNQGVHILEFLNHGHTDKVLLRTRQPGGEYDSTWPLTANEIRQIIPGKDHITFASVPCLLGNIDFGDTSFPAGECFAQVDLVSPGGSVGGIYNSRKSLFTIPFPVAIDARTMEFIVIDNYKLSWAHYMTLPSFLNPDSPGSRLFRTCEVLMDNLFGCPAMGIYLMIPCKMAVTYPTKISLSGHGDMPGHTYYPIPVTVKDKSNNLPISGAYVTLWKGNEIFDRKMTASNGIAAFYEYFDSPGAMSVDVSRPNYIPYQGQISITASLGLGKPDKPADVLPALIWNPYHLASGDSILSSLLSADYQAVQTDSLLLFSDSLSNYYLFVMGGIYELADSMIQAPFYNFYQAEIDTFLSRGGKCFWEGAWSILFSDTSFNSLIYHCFQFAAVYNDFSYSYLRGVPDTYFENIDSLGIEQSVTDDVLGVWQGGIATPIRAPETPYAGPKAAINVYNSSRTILTNFSWSKLHDRYANTRRDLIIDVMNWLSGSAQNAPDKPIPISFFLSQNYPNPFNAATTIKYDLPKASDVSIDIFDILGRKVETLLSEKQTAGSHSVVWNAKDATSGVYFYKIIAGESSETKRCLLLK